MTEPRFPFVDLQAQRERLGPDIEGALQRVLTHGQFVLGPEVAELETALAARADGVHVVSCASGTDALWLAMMALGIGPGDAVVVPAFTFVATAGAVSLTGATPVFADVSADTACLDPHGLAAAANAARSAGLTPRVAIAVDLYGQPADYDELHKHADAEGMTIVADAAQSFGGAYRDRPVGALASVTTTSFFPSKPLGAYGDGGAVFTDDPAVAADMVSRREHGRGDARYDIERLGANARLDTMQAAVLLQKLTVFDDELDARQAVAERYDEGLAGVVATPTIAVARRSTWAQYTIRVDHRDDVQARLTAQGIPTAVHYPAPLHHQPAHRDAVRAEELGVSEQLAREVLSLPMHPYLPSGHQVLVIEAVRDAVEQG